MLGKTGAENASQFRIDKCTSNQIFIKKFWLGMMGKAGAEKRPSQSLALHCSDRCAVQKEKDKDKYTIYRNKKGV